MEDLINAIVLLLNFLVVPALSYGSQLALGALGVTLIYSVLRFSNFAHGETMAFGTMFVILATWLLQSWGVSLGPLPTALLALPAGCIVTILFLLATDRLVYKHYREHKATNVIFMIASVGVMFVMNGIIRFVIGPDGRVTDAVTAESLEPGMDACVETVIRGLTFPAPDHVINVRYPFVFRAA